MENVKLGDFVAVLDDRNASLRRELNRTNKIESKIQEEFSKKSLSLPVSG